MKRSRVLIFILSVIAMLTLLSAVFPSGGIKAGLAVLRFPSVADILEGAVPEEPRVSPEELLENRKAAVHRAEKDRFEDFFKSDPARFYLPDGDARFFDPLFAALEGASVKPVRIIHYGDSQIEEDRITSAVRAALQERFGGDGQGMLPARRYFTPAMAVSSSSEQERFTVFGERPEGLRKFGPYGDFVRLDTTLTLGFSPVRSRDKGQELFNRLTLVAGNIDGELKVQKPLKRLHDVEIPAGKMGITAALWGKKAHSEDFRADIARIVYRDELLSTPAIRKEADEWLASVE